MLMGLKENTVKSILMTVKIMTVKIILLVLMGLTTTHAFAHLSTQVGNAQPSVHVSECIMGILLHVFSKPLHNSITGRCLGN